MPMIDIYAVAGTFPDKHKLAQQAANIVMEVEKVPDIPMFRRNTAAFIHELPDEAFANVDGEHSYVRISVTTNAGALDREKQIEVVRKLTLLAAVSAEDPGLMERTWVILSEAAEGGWGLKGHAHTNAELVTAARAEIAKLKA